MTPDWVHKNFPYEQPKPAAYGYKSPMNNPSYTGTIVAVEKSMINFPMNPPTVTRTPKQIAFTCAQIIHANGETMGTHSKADAILDAITEALVHDPRAAQHAETVRLLSEVYRNTNLRHHPELTGLADLVSQHLQSNT
jgi:hypothetical protein